MAGDHQPFEGVGLGVVHPSQLGRRRRVGDVREWPVNGGQDRHRRLLRTRPGGACRPVPVLSVQEEEAQVVPPPLPPVEPGARKRCSAVRVAHAAHLDDLLGLQGRRSPSHPAPPATRAPLPPLDPPPRQPFLVPALDATGAGLQPGRQPRRRLPLVPNLLTHHQQTRPSQ